MTQSMSYFLQRCDCSVPYCASLEAWNWVVAEQHLNANHRRSSIWPNPNVSIFSGNFFKTTLNCNITSTFRAFDLIQKLRARPEYQLSSGTKYIKVIQCDLHRHYLDSQRILNNAIGQNSNAIKYKFMTWIWSPFRLKMSSHMSFSHTKQLRKKSI